MMMTLRYLAGFLLAFLVGASARWFDIPVPAPPKFIGAFLIVTITAGYISVDEYIEYRSSADRSPPVEQNRATGEPDGDGTAPKN